MLRVEFHCHSIYSKDSLSWPEDLIWTCRKKGIDRLVITDHNTIDGAMEIAHLPGFFISEEVTTYFPEDG